MKERDIDELQKHIHYLKVLHMNSTVYQPEIRTAIEYAIDILTDYIDAIKD